ncbi:MAG: SH3 domain-containing protein, partial [Pseudomonadota bacterium]
MRVLLYCLVLSLFLSSKAWGLCVIADQANLRDKPSAKGKLLWTVGKYMPFIGIKQEGKWLFVKDMEGKKMWIFSGLVSDEIDCAVIKVKNSSLRKGPGTKFKKTPFSVAKKFAPFRKLDRDGAWLLLQDDYGYKHWVYENNLWEPLAYTQLCQRLLL